LANYMDYTTVNPSSDDPETTLIFTHK